MKKAAFLILIPLFLSTWLLFSGQSLLPLEVKRQDSELELIREGRAYLLMDFSSGIMMLKNRGVVLRRWRVNRMRAWGFPFALEPAKLQGKRSRNEPRREKIKSGDTSWGESGLVALELTDMPARFKLLLDNGIQIYSASPKKGMARLLDLVDTGFRRSFLFPLKTTAAAFRKKSFHALEIELDSREEAQAFYWALDPGISVLILPDLK